MSADQTHVASTIRQFNGFIARYVGDGVLIYFGWPEAHAQLFPGDDFARLLEESEQNLINLALQLQPGPIPRHFLPLLVNPKRPKTYIPA